MAARITKREANRPHVPPDARTPQIEENILDKTKQTTKLNDSDQALNVTTNLQQQEIEKHVRDATRALQNPD